MEQEQAVLKKQNFYQNLNGFFFFDKIAGFNRVISILMVKRRTGQ
jgi:hypothetical protein